MGTMEGERERWDLASRRAAVRRRMKMEEDDPIKPPIKPPMPVIIQTQTPQPTGGVQYIPMAGMGGGGGIGARTMRRGDGIKITNTQTVNERSRRRRAASKDKKSRKKRASKEYTKIKKQIMTKVRKSRAAEYKYINKKISKLPVKQRKSARDRARKALMKRQKEHFSKLKPGITTLERLRGLLKKGVQWTQ